MLRKEEPQIDTDVKNHLTVSTMTLDSPQFTPRDL